MIELKAYAGLIRNHKELSLELGVFTDDMTREQREGALMVAAYERWGVNMGTHINGQFGAALFDTETQQLFCLRDVLGAELFFYYQTAEGKVLVGNAIKDLFGQAGFVRALNEEMIQFYLAFTYLPGEETLFKGVFKLEPGGYLTYSAEEGLQLGTYWELAFEPDDSKTLDQWADAVDEAMEASLRDICDPDQACDSFLSGGVDSSFILAKSRARTGFCAAYENQQASEEEDAQATAAYLGRRFEGIIVTPEEFLANVDEFLRAFELPTADVAALSLYSACKQIKEGGKSTLCFSGEGADEFFGGYSVYNHTPALRKILEPVYHGTTYIMNAKEQARFSKRYFPARSTEQFVKQRSVQGAAYDELGQKLYTDLRTYFEGSILYNSTKISRGTGLDIRMPFCDLRMFEVSLRMPSRFKNAEGGNKLALRAAARRVLPQEVAYRKKLGFPVPVRAWLQTEPFMQEISRALNSDTAKRLLNEEEVQALLAAFKGEKPAVHGYWYKRHEPLLWRYVWACYTLVRWYELFFLQA